MSHCLVFIKVKVSFDIFVLIQWDYLIPWGLPYTLSLLFQIIQQSYLLWWRLSFSFCSCHSPFISLFFFFFITEACDSSRMVPLCFSFCVSSFIVIHSVLSCLTFSTPPSSLLLLPLCSSVVVCSTQQTSAGRQCSVGMARRGQTPVIVAASFLILQQLVAGRQK